MKRNLYSVTVYEHEFYGLTKTECINLISKNHAYKVKGRKLSKIYMNMAEMFGLYLHPRFKVYRLTI